MRDMARAYLTKAGMPRNYWYFAVSHAACMMNIIPGTGCGKLTTAFELVHRVAPGVRTWILIFLIVFFHLKTDNDDACGVSTSMIRIAVGRSEKNQCTQSLQFVYQRLL